MTTEEPLLQSPATSPHANGHAAKRVSFGNDDVRTFIYEKESDDVTPILPRQPFTDPEAPVNRVTVTTDTVRPESPRPIAPPTQCDQLLNQRNAVSPPLPSKKMAEHENPFRPEEILYHEVDPIVEQYMHKPFPPSRPGSAQNTPAKQQRSESPEAPAYLQNGLSKEQLLQHEKPLIDTQYVAEKKHADSGAAGVDYTDDLPPAGKVELVHVKRKKCGCCTVQ